MKILMKKLEKLSKVLKQCLKRDANIPPFSSLQAIKKELAEANSFFIYICDRLLFDVSYNA